MKTHQGEKFHGSNSEFTSCFQAVVYTHTQLQLLHIINVLIIHNYPITKGESQVSVLLKMLKSATFRILCNVDHLTISESHKLFVCYLRVL